MGVQGMVGVGHFRGSEFMGYVGVVEAGGLVLVVESPGVEFLRCHSIDLLP